MQNKTHTGITLCHRHKFVVLVLIDNDTFFYDDLVTARYHVADPKDYRCRGNLHRKKPSPLNVWKLPLSKIDIFIHKFPPDEAELVMSFAGRSQETVRFDRVVCMQSGIINLKSTLTAFVADFNVSIGKVTGH